MVADGVRTLSASTKAGVNAQVEWFGYRRDMHDVLAFDEGALLGQGGYGRVTLAKDRATGVGYAIKTIPKTRPGMGFGATIKYHNMLRREVDIHSALARFYHVVKLFNVYEDEEAIHLQLELCAGGSLLEHWDSEHGADGFDEEDARVIARQVVQTVAQCHAKYVAFRDIKAENFLYTEQGASGVLKLSDFGLACYQRPSDPPYTDKCGTPSYVAPEVLHRSAGLQADMWSAGVLIYRVLSGRMPFVGESNAELFSAIQSHNPDFTSDPWPRVSQEAVALVSGMLVKDPSRRLTAKRALQSAWLTHHTTHE